MQVTGGKFKRKRLQSADTERVRPTARRLRESLFEFLAARIENARFLDLCAGSGAVGIEALSRGAAHTTFVDRSPKICSFIKANLKRCEVSAELAEVVTGEAAGFLRRMARAGTGDEWDIIFFDPPYAADYAPVIELCSAADQVLLRRGGVLVVEHHCDNLLPERTGVMRRWRVVRQGESCLSFYERRK